MKNNGQVMFDILLYGVLLIIMIYFAFYHIFVVENKLINDAKMLEKKRRVISIMNYLLKRLGDEKISIEKVWIMSHQGIGSIKKRLEIENEIYVRIWGKIDYYETKNRCNGFCMMKGVIIEEDRGFIEVCAC